MSWVCLEGPGLFHDLMWPIDLVTPMSLYGDLSLYIHRKVVIN